MKNINIKMRILVICMVLFSALISCKEEEMSRVSTANTVTSFSSLGQWSADASMITDSEGYLYTLISGCCNRLFSANLEDEFTVNGMALVKTNNRGELIWKVEVPNLPEGRQLTIDDEDHIYIPTIESEVLGNSSSAEAWVRVATNGFVEIIRQSQISSIPKDVRWLSTAGTIKSKDGKNFITSNVVLKSFDYETEVENWSLSGAIGSYIDTDDEGNIYGADNAQVSKLNSQGELIATFPIPVEYRGIQVKGLKVFENAFYLAIEGNFEIRDTRLITYTNGFQNDFVEEPCIAKFNKNSGDRIWVQKLRSKYVQIEDEFIGDIYLDVLVPPASITNLIQDDYGNMWFNFVNYQKQDIGNTIGIETSFGAFTSTIDARAGGETLANLVSIKP